MPFYVIFKKVCSNPNVANVHCWKSLIASDSTTTGTVLDLIGLSDCKGFASTDCGLFCARSEMQCAKVSLKIISAISGVASALSGGFSTKAKNLEEAATILAKKPPSFWSKLLKSGKAIYNLQSVAEMRETAKIFAKLVGLILSDDFDCKNL